MEFGSDALSIRSLLIAVTTSAPALTDFTLTKDKFDRDCKMRSYESVDESSNIFAKLFYDFVEDFVICFHKIVNYAKRK